MSLLVILFFSAIVAVQGNSKARPVVSTEYGAISGRTLATLDGFHFDVFLGIPFAQPPTGELRFEKPQPPVPWSGILEAHEHPHACLPLVRSRHGAVANVSEDCLYLNVFGPYEKKDLHPVMVVIHFGGFATGSARLYGDYHDIATNFVSQGLVVVVVQYRLGVHGFVSTGDNELPGNLGLWDQVAALKFIKASIREFGGDPGKITLFGCSAGAASVSALSASPRSRGLFTQSIQMSGSSVAGWATNVHTPGETAWLLELIGCKDHGDLPAKDCLKRTSNEKIALATEKMNVAELYFITPVFGPRIDGDLFPTEIGHLILGAPQKPTLLGLVEEESAHFTVFPPPSLGRRLAIPPEKQATFGPDDFEDFVVSAIGTKGNSVEYVRRILDFYMQTDNASEVKDSAFYVKRYTELCSDIQFNVPVLQELLAKEVSDWPLFAYLNKYLSGREQAKPPRNVVTHLYDHNFVFRGGNQLDPMNFTQDDEAVSRFLIAALVSFVKTGNPSSGEFTWPVADVDDPLRHVNIKLQPVRTEMFLDRLKFWSTLDAVVEGGAGQTKRDEL